MCHSRNSARMYSLKCSKASAIVSMGNWTNVSILLHKL
jgi:hypothetical protein